MSVCNSVKIDQQSSELHFLRQAPKQWRESPEKPIVYAPKEETIFLSGGLTLLQDSLIEAALRSLGYHFIALPEPDFDAFRTGKAYGNKAQCNPTYFTVGNLVKYLIDLRDNHGISSEEIVRRYVYITAGGCGPCRFGMYITEYKKALRDAGFEGFRITSFDHEKGIFQGDDIETQLIDYTPSFFIRLIKAVVIGDLLNIAGYRMRPYETTAGATDAALAQCRALLSDAFLEGKSLPLTLLKARKLLNKVPLDRSIKKPKVMVMGEFWASLTEGDGNYGLYRFLESEGAECIPQPVLNRLMLSIWEAKEANEKRRLLPSDQTIDFSYAKTRFLVTLAKKAIEWHVKLYAKLLGIRYRLPDMDKLAELGKKYYTIECNGGEGHLEVAHLIEAVKEKLAHLVISVKPFGCMPSSGVSDGVQSLVTAHFPEANFLAVETSGEGAANFYSRVQMALFKAKEALKEEGA